MNHKTFILCEMCMYCQFRIMVKSITLAFKQTINYFINYFHSTSIKTIINKNGNKIFRKKNITTFINYFHSISIKTIINKNGNKIFRKKIFQISLIILLIISIVHLLKQLLIKTGIKFFEKKYSNFH